jgi:hypothetical protein
MEMCFVVKRFLEQALRNLEINVHFSFCRTKHVYTNCISKHNIQYVLVDIKSRTEDGGPATNLGCSRIIVHPSLRLSWNFCKLSGSS